MIVVPEFVRLRAVAHGEEAWLDSLPERVDDLAERWDLVVEGAMPGGTVGCVVAVTTADGAPAALKLLPPSDADKHERTVLGLADGQGCVTLLDHDEGHAALLLERLGPSLFDLRVPIGRRHEIMCVTASRLWRRIEPGQLPTGAERADHLAAEIVQLWTDLDRPCTERAIEQAVECAGRRREADDPERAVLVHGDVHQWNTLQTLAGDSYKLVDPDGVHAEPEYDLGIVMREDPAELIAGDPRERSRRVAAMTGRDETAIWEWGVVERLSNGLLSLFDGMTAEAAEILHAVDVVAALDP